MRSRSGLVVKLAGLGCALGLGALSNPGIDTSRLGCDPISRSQGPHLRVVTWNLRNFPGHHDRERLRDLLSSVRPDVVAFQEVLDPTALAELLPGYQLMVSEGGGRHGQRVAAALRSGRVVPTGPAIEETSLSLGGKVRPALHLTLRDDAQDASFDLTVVHLKATPSGLEERRRQWLALAELLRSRGGARSIVVGDFNATGPRGTEADPSFEHRRIDEALREVGLHRLAVVGECTAYWQGVRHDAWVEPSLLDLVFVGSDWSPDGLEPVAIPLAQCRTHRCRAFRSTDAYPDLWQRDASDHCPVVVDLPVRFPH